MPFEILLIVIVSIVGGLVYSAYEQHVKLKISTQKNQHDDSTLATIAELQERVQVLEKIVTDEKYNLHHEISALDKAS